jgi:hypothetical protein
MRVGSGLTSILASFLLFFSGCESSVDSNFLIGELADSSAISGFSTPNSLNNWIAVDDQGLIYQGSIQASSGVVFSSIAVGSLPSGVLPIGSHILNLLYDGTHYLLTLGSFGPGAAAASNSLFISSDLSHWNSWTTGITASSRITSSYFDGTKWWITLYDYTGTGQSLYYRSPLDTQWTQAQGGGLAPWSGLSIILFQGLHFFGQFRAGYVGSCLWYSSNGINFNSDTGTNGNTLSINMNAISSMSTNGSNIMIGSSYYGSPSMFYSTDGLNWNSSSLWDSVPAGGPTSGGNPSALIYDGTYFYSGVDNVGSPPYLFRSTDGNSWSSQGISGLSHSITLKALWYSQGVYAAFDSVDGVVKVSTDGLSFSTLQHPVLGRSFIMAYPQRVLTNWN